MTTKTMKVPRGTARKLRRSGIAQGVLMLPAVAAKRSARNIWRLARAEMRK